MCEACVTTGTQRAVIDEPPAAHLAAIQRRTLAVLAGTQILGGVGVAVGIAVGTLLAAHIGGTGLAGFGQSALVIGAALLVIPVTRLTRRRGRRPALILAYLAGTAGAALVVLAAGRGSIPLLLLGFMLFGGASTANLQGRYAAMDLAEPARRGRQLSLVVWATTVGAVVGPNLAPIANTTIHQYGLPEYSGPFAVSAVAFLLAATVLAVALRPDPLLVARRAGPRTPAEGPTTAAEASAGRSGLGAALREVAGVPAARLGLAAVAVGHIVMVSVMSMTPVRLSEGGHGDDLRIVGVVLSAHIAGMYAFSPVTGWCTDRFGRRPVILGGIALLIVACATAGTAGHDTIWIGAGLILLGMGWSATMVAGSTLLSESVAAANRPSVQGLSDLVMGSAGALAGAASGLIVAWSEYPTLTMLAAMVTIPLLALALRPVRPLVGDEGS